MTKSPINTSTLWRKVLPLPSFVAVAAAICFLHFLPGVSLGQHYAMSTGDERTITISESSFYDLINRMDSLETYVVGDKPSDG